MTTLKTIATSLLVLIVAAQAHANIELPWLLSDGAVLQRNEPIPIWGSAPANSTLKVTFAGESREVKADSGGHWQTFFSPRKAGGPYQLDISSENYSRTVHDLLLGDVWVCSGQSNMEWVVRDSDGAE